MTTFKIDKTRGLLHEVTYLASQHCDDRPEGTIIDLLVIHGISLPPGEFGERFVNDLFTGQLKINQHPYFKSIATLKVSAHALICRDGRVIQYVPFIKRAWHAGQSQY